MLVAAIKYDRATIEVHSPKALIALFQSLCGAGIFNILPIRVSSTCYRVEFICESESFIDKTVEFINDSCPPAQQMQLFLNL